MESELQKLRSSAEKASDREDIFDSCISKIKATVGDEEARQKATMKIEELEAECEQGKHEIVSLTERLNTARSKNHD